ncbi:putative S-adenosyl-L-methionine-dependent methyltransferase [Gracilariopsis chorda]|uniref:Putative S-adenosyl-L-methionine-dependent methyltransferase n=1 Tax=Gracilariopsis chorda TaxID=448386 RepID=A0A2V3J1W6_9FLOR|nr:putative S-adenosyl-L-methionine-dependent methyltransferase [Gracilariopsis chorda]|eukprot:PXF47967.1 putative S-adenosyl-L-methionine-dependent methyltransferase [Gracilariopsis chorda]
MSSKTPASYSRDAQRHILRAQFHAAIRAIESQRNDALIRDPYAARLAGISALSHAQDMQKVYTENLIRARYLDDLVSRYLSGIGDVQLVLLGAGMDTRPYRLTEVSNSVSVFEIDFPDVVELKEELIDSMQPSPLCQAAALTRIKVDHTAHDSHWVSCLLDAGFQTCRRSVWHIERRNMRFSDGRLQDILKDISALSPTGSILFLDVNTNDDGRDLCDRGCEDDVSIDSERFFNRLGFSLLDCDVIGGQNASYGRWDYGSPSSVALLTASKTCMKRFRC